MTNPAKLNPKMIRPRFYLARRDTRWDPYPTIEPTEVIAHDCHGFWAFNPESGWFKTPTSYVFQREIPIEQVQENLEFLG